MNDKVSLTEFLHLAQLSRQDLISMLDNGELPVEIGPMGEVIVDLTRTSPESIARRPLRTGRFIPEEERFLYAEVVGNVLTSELDSIVEEALELALTWLEKRRSTETKD